MKTTFAFASGTVQGRDHRLQGRNNQDAFFLLEREDVTVAIVCDGCSSGAHSEIGARLGAEYAARLIANVAVGDYQLSEADPDAGFPMRKSITPKPPYFKPWYVSNELATEINRPIPYSSMPRDIDPAFRSFVMEHLLFTIVGVAITSEMATFFALGDGVIVVNGEVTTLGPFKDNAPPYLGYRLLSPHSRKHPDIQVVREIPMAELNSFVIGTDGVTHLIDAAEKTVPGKTELIGPLSRLWTEDRFFKNRDMVRRYLTLANQDATTIDWESRTVTKDPGRLSDDTTLIVGRRKEI